MKYTAIIKIEKIADVTRFVQMASALKGEVTVRKNNLKIDGRSIMGLFSIDPSTPVEVEFENDESALAEAFMEFLEPFLVA